MRAGNCDAEADIEEIVVVGALAVLLEHEILARRQQEGALVPVVDEVAIGDEHLKPVPAPAGELGILAAHVAHPADKRVARAERRHQIPGIGLGHVRPGRRGRQDGGRDAAGQKTPPLQLTPPRRCHASDDAL
jgi:hypothetical protein